ncbi:hypothetical protein JCM10212_006738 [Sporobolomyces blumeae]
MMQIDRICTKAVPEHWNFHLHRLQQSYKNELETPTDSIKGLKRRATLAFVREDLAKIDAKPNHGGTALVLSVKLAFSKLEDEVLIGFWSHRGVDGKSQGQHLELGLRDLLREYEAKDRDAMEASLDQEFWEEHWNSCAMEVWTQLSDDDRRDVPDDFLYPSPAASPAEDGHFEEDYSLASSSFHPSSRRHAQLDRRLPAASVFSSLHPF